MRKIFLLTVSLIACFSMCISSFATEVNPIEVINDNLVLQENQIEFESVIEIEPQENYAGIEMAIVCPEGVSLKKATASAGSMSAPPVLKDGVYWTSFFESDNSMSGGTCIILSFECEKDFTQGEIELSEVKVLNKNGFEVTSQSYKADRNIILSRENKIISPPTNNLEKQDNNTGMIVIFGSIIIIFAILTLLFIKAKPKHK